MHTAATMRAASIRAFALSVGLAAMLGEAASTATRDEEFSPAGPSAPYSAVQIEAHNGGSNAARL
jgi:hypothetical protein